MKTMQDLKTQQDNRERRLVELYESFTQYTDKIERKLQEKQNAEIQRQATQDAMLSIERQIEQDILFDTIDVTDPKDVDAPPNKKPRYTNDAQRQNEKYYRLQNNETHVNLRVNFEETSAKIESLRIEIDVLEKRFRARQAQAQLEALLPQYFTVTAQPLLSSAGTAQTEKQ